MRLCLLADAASVHTRRWSAALAARGHLVTVLSLRPAEIEGVRVVALTPPRGLAKLGYVTVAGRVRRHLRTASPDLLHAHYATSYGLLGALTGFHPFVISVWGTDVLGFPRRSPLHAALLRHNLDRADVVTSTSRCMAEEAGRRTRTPVRVVPFGVDLTRFQPGSDEATDEVVVGMVKALEPTYGVPTLIEAFERLAPSRPHVRLLIVGDGSQRRAIEGLVARSPVGGRVRLSPRVPHERVPEVMRSIDVFAVPSRSESFGVAAIEAAACGLPVVASCVGGLPEVVLDGETGLLVEPGDPAALATALETLVDSPELRRRLGAAGRALVERAYAWDRCVDVMEAVYTSAR